MSLDLLACRQAEEDVSSLQVARGANHYHRGGASHHGVCGRWFIMDLTVRPEWQPAVLCEVQLVLVYNLLGDSVSDTPDFARKAFSHSTT